MLVFIDESGDLGYKFDRGSTLYFTVVLVIFEDVQAAQSCQRAIEQLRISLGVPPRYEFHFRSDSHSRRLAFLTTVARQDFHCYSFTLDKASPRLTGRGFKYRSPAYKWVCKSLLENAAGDLRAATVVIDGSGERKFRQEISTYLRKELNSEQRKQISRVKIGRSSSDPLLQLADYVAGVTNRLYGEKEGADAYEVYLRRKRRSQRKWP